MCNSPPLLQVRAGAEPPNLAVGDPEVVEVGPAMFSIPQVPDLFQTVYSQTHSKIK